MPQHSAVDEIKCAILDHSNPFAVEGVRLHNMITLVYVPDEFVEKILNANNTVQNKCMTIMLLGTSMTTLVFWPSIVTKVDNRMFVSGSKSTVINLRDKTVDLNETKDMYVRLMILAKSTRNIDKKYAISNHELTLTPI